MANLITADNDLFTAYVHGQQRRSNRDFLQRHLEQGSNVLREGGRRFMERAREAFESFDMESVERGLRAVKRRLTGRWTENDVRPLFTMGDLQQANVRMQRWLMTSPLARKMAAKDRCWGFRDSYVDLEPGAVGERHTDWKRVHNGQAVTDEEGNTHFVTYFDALDENGHEQLQHDEQRDIIESVDCLEFFLSLGKDDPSSQSNGSL